MKVALIHFSDFHISSQEDFIVTNVSKIAAACRLMCIIMNYLAKRNNSLVKLQECE